MPVWRHVIFCGSCQTKLELTAAMIKTKPAGQLGGVHYVFDCPTCDRQHYLPQWKEKPVVTEAVEQVADRSGLYLLAAAD